MSRQWFGRFSLSLSLLFCRFGSFFGQNSISFCLSRVLHFHVLWSIVGILSIVPG